MAVQSAGTLLGLRLMMTVLPMLVLAGALVLFRRKFVLTDARAAEISAQLHGEEAHQDVYKRQQSFSTRSNTRRR